MMELVREMLSYSFLAHALVDRILASLYTFLLGISLMLKRYSMIGDGLSHVSFGALSVILAIGWPPSKLSIPVVALAAFSLPRTTENGKMKSDAAIAIMLASTLAVGIMVTSTTTGMTTDVNSYMFDNILAMSPSGMRLSVALSVTVLGLFLFYYNKIFAVISDESFVKVTGIRVSWYNILIAVLMTVTIMLDVRMMGAMLISSLVTFPVLTSIRVFKGFRGVVLPAGVVSVVRSDIGMAVSYRFFAPARISVVLVSLAALILFTLAQIVIRRLIRKD